MSNPLGFDSPFDDLIGQFFGGRDPFSVLGAERPRRRCNESICPGRCRKTPGHWSPGRWNWPLLGAARTNGQHPSLQDRKTGMHPAFWS